jgi:hypothetical protein
MPEVFFSSGSLINRILRLVETMKHVGSGLSLSSSYDAVMTQQYSHTQLLFMLEIWIVRKILERFWRRELATL